MSHSFESLTVSGFMVSSVSESSKMLQLRQLFVNTVSCGSQEAPVFLFSEQLNK